MTMVQALVLIAFALNMQPPIILPYLGTAGPSARVIMEQVVTGSEQFTCGTHVHGGVHESPQHLSIRFGRKDSSQQHAWAHLHGLDLGAGEQVAAGGRHGHGGVRAARQHLRLAPEALLERQRHRLPLGLRAWHTGRP